MNKQFRSAQHICKVHKIDRHSLVSKFLPFLLDRGTYLILKFYIFQECYCCRENYLRERLVTLTHCYDPDGLRLEEEDKAVMEVRLREPAECKCYKCGDFSR